MSTIDEKSLKKRQYLQIIIIKTEDGMTYEYFGYPIHEPSITGLSIGPKVPKEDVVRYLNQGAKWLLEGNNEYGDWAIN